MGGEFVRLEVDGGIGTIRLERPPMNALNKQVQEEIRAAALEASARDDVRAVIVYGGQKVFAAGADIKEMADLSYVDMALRAGPLSSSFTAVAEIPKPTVAAVTGYALGEDLPERSRRCRSDDPHHHRSDPPRSAQPNRRR